MTKRTFWNSHTRGQYIAGFENIPKNEIGQQPRPIIKRNKLSQAIRRGIFFGTTK